MQKMSGKGSAPLARDNGPVSIFAKEGKTPAGAGTVQPAKAPKAAAPVPAAAQPATGTASTATGTHAATPATPRATPATAKPAPTRADLDAIQAKRVDNGIARMFAKQVAAQVALSGMTAEQAVSAVLADARKLVEDALVELKGTSGLPANGVVRHFFNRTRAQQAAGAAPADALAGAFAAYHAVVLRELPNVPAKPVKTEKAAKPAKTSEPAK